MLFRNIFTFLFLALFSFGAIYISYNFSSQEALKAKFYYLIGNYSKANKWAYIAYGENRYNSMALTILGESKIALEYINFINLGNDYLKRVNYINSKKKVSLDDKMSIKTMSKIVLENYKKLSHANLISQDLVKRAKKINEKFIQYYNK